jgi:hypothetical protein
LPTSGWSCAMTLMNRCKGLGCISCMQGPTQPLISSPQPGFQGGEPRRITLPLGASGPGWMAPRRTSPGTAWMTAVRRGMPTVPFSSAYFPASLLSVQTRSILRRCACGRGQGDPTVRNAGRARGSH